MNEYRQDERIDQRARSTYELADAVNRLASILEKCDIGVNGGGNAANDGGKHDNDIQPEDPSSKAVATD